MNPQLLAVARLHPHRHILRRFHTTAHSASFPQNCFHKNRPPQRQTFPRRYEDLGCPSQLQRMRGWVVAASSAARHSLIQKERSCRGARSEFHFLPCLQSWRLRHPGPRPDQTLPHRQLLTVDVTGRPH